MVPEMVSDNQVNPASLVYQVTAVEPVGEVATVTEVVLGAHQTLPHVTYAGLNFKYYPVDLGHQLVNQK